MASFKIFTINAGNVSHGAVVSSQTLKGAGVTIPVIQVGEEGRGRKLGSLPVDLPKDLYEKWKKGEKVTIMAAEVGKTKSGNPKLFAKHREDDYGSCIAVMPTKTGFRGSNAHTGDRTPGTMNSSDPEFMKFPGEIICEGMIADGLAGRMGSGNQYVAVIPAETVFRTCYGGRLYGAPSAHYYRFDGTTSLQALTWDERQTSDLW